MQKTPRFWIDGLGLIAHPEGGYYRESYRSNLTIPREALSLQLTGPRLVSSAIYFLIEGDNFSAFLRLRSDEMWILYYGVLVVVDVIDEACLYLAIMVGS